jgi:drug/metabolite transporter, DME family
MGGIPAGENNSDNISQRERTTRRSGRATVSVLAAALLFGTTGTAKELGPDEATALGVGSVRLVVGAAVLLVAALGTRRLRRADLELSPVAVLVGGLAVALYQLGFFVGTTRSGVALGTLLALGAGPVAAGIIHAVRAGSPPPTTWFVASGGALVGVALLMGGQGYGQLDVVGLMASLVAGVSFAVYATTVGHLIERGADPVGAMALTFGAGAVLLLPVLASQPLQWVASPGGLLLALHLGVVTIAVAYTWYGWGLSVLPVAIVVTLTLAEPVTAALLGWLVLDQSIEPVGWLGVAIVVLALALIGRATGPAARARRYGPSDEPAAA